MTTLREQLADPIYRKWFATSPKMKVSGFTPPWWVYVQREPDGPWARAEFQTWAEGYRYVAKNLKKFHDMALTHKRQLFRPPVVTEKASGKRRYHFPPGMDDPLTQWCGYCRRVTVFRYFNRHHAFPAWACAGDERRCSICGARLRTVLKVISGLR